MANSWPALGNAGNTATVVNAVTGGAGAGTGVGTGGVDGAVVYSFAMPALSPFSKVRFFNSLVAAEAHMVCSEQGVPDG